MDQQGKAAGRTLGGVVKPKFTPKAPQRSSSTAEKSKTQQGSQSDSSHNRTPGAQPPRDTSSTSSSAPRNKNPRHAPGLGAGRGGRSGRGTVTAGSTFFSGSMASSTGAGHHYSPDVNVVIKKEPVHSGGDSLVSPAHSDSTHTAAVVEPKREPKEEILEGEDAEDACIRKLCTSEPGTATESYRPLAPVSLSSLERPPRDVHILAAAAAAQTEEERALRMREEEEQDIFLIQLPSTLQLGGSTNAATPEPPPSEEQDKFVLRPLGVPASAASDLQASRSKTSALYGSEQVTRLSPGHVGRLQVMKSGRVFLVLNGGPGGNALRHEVNLGVNTNFVQTLVSVPENSSTDPHADTTGAQREVVRSECSKEVQQSAAAKTYRNMYVLGDITKKLVVTPEFPE